jgi:hypothetical protein
MYSFYRPDLLLLDGEFEMGRPDLGSGEEW